MDFVARFLKFEQTESDNHTHLCISYLGHSSAVNLVTPVKWIIGHLRFVARPIIVSEVEVFSSIHSAALASTLLVNRTRILRISVFPSKTKHHEILVNNTSKL